MRARLFASLALALFASTASADELDDAVAALKKDAPFATERLGLFAAGWLPAPDQTLTSAERCSARDEICLAYPETSGCSGTGQAFCSFRYIKPDGALLSLRTVGEPVTDLTVDGWEVTKP